MVGAGLLPIALRRCLRRYFPRPPVNFRARDSAPAQIDADVAYAFQVARAYLSYFAAEGIDPRGKTVLELGPGINLGGAFLLASHGARLIVADRFLADWDARYHGRFYTALRNALAEQDPTADPAVLDRLVERSSYTDDDVRRVRCGAEDLRGILDASIDAVVSNAVLEHLYDLPAACRELARVSKPLAWQFHQVDFRDHRNFARPLEYLLLGDREFRRTFAERHGECGSQWRPCEVAQFFEKAGFEVIRFEPNMFADEHYLAELAPRLKSSVSRYRNTPIAYLRPLGGLFRIRRLPSALQPRD